MEQFIEVDYDKDLVKNDEGVQKEPTIVDETLEVGKDTNETKVHEA